MPGDPPPPLRQGDGVVELELYHPLRYVQLDSAAFHTLWRYVESHALQLHNNPSAHARLPEEVFLRAVAAFREAQRLTPPGEGRKKTWKRT